MFRPLNEFAFLRVVDDPLDFSRWNRPAGGVSRLAYSNADNSPRSIHDRPAALGRTDRRRILQRDRKIIATPRPVPSANLDCRQQGQFE